MKCKNKKCKTCPAVVVDEHVNRLNIEGPICKATGIIYMINCGYCNIKYIGQTSTPLHLRINNHRSLCNKVLSKDTDIQNRYEFEHFKLHPFNHAKIKILDVIDDYNNRIELENLYIIKYKTVYPYGLNDRVNNISVTAIKNETCIHKEIFSNITFDATRSIRRRSSNKINMYIDFNELVNDIDNAIVSKNNMVHYIKGKILGLKRSKAKIFTKYVRDFDFRYYLVKDLVFDLLKYKLNNQDWLNHTYVETFKSYLVINFEHKYIDALNIPQLIHNQALMSCFPIKETYPKISFKYSQTLGSMVFNYAKFSKELHIENLEHYVCECNQSLFKDEFHNHIITGNLNVLEDNELINIFNFGSKFRVIPKLNIHNMMSSIINNIDVYIHRLSFKFNVNIGQFNEWRSKVLENIRNKIAITPNTFRCTINQRVLRNKIREIQNRFVIIPVDKANSNFAFICKKYYAQILINEVNSNDTFELCNVNVSNIKDLFVNFLKPYHLSPSCYNIPFIYSIPKFHKNPVKFRFITSSFNCINKDSSIILNLSLNMLYSRIQNDCDNSWIINNNKKVIDAISYCNENPGMPGNFMLSSFDFSTLYTALPHSDLIRCIVALYNKYIDSDIEVIHKYKKITISKVQFVELLKFCIKNSYVIFNDRIYRQKIGIPMGSNFSPNLANLYLHFYESQFLSKSHVEGRNRYKNTFRFIDDLLSLNNRDILFDVRAIYPRFLEIKNTNNEPYRIGSFLDLEIKVDGNKFNTKVYDKRRDFNFNILGLPAFSSNIPNNMTYGIICSQFSRFASNCMLGEDFITNCQLIINKIYSNGYPNWLLKKYVKKFMYKKNRTIAKFDFDTDLINLIDFNL